MTAPGGARARSVCMLGLQCTLHPLLTNRVYREIARAAARASASRRCAIPRFKARVLEADGARGGLEPAAGRVIDAFDRMFELGDPPDYEPDPASSIAARAAREGRDPLDLAYDLLLGDDGRAFLYLPFLNYADGNLDAVGEMLAAPEHGGRASATAARTSAPSATRASRPRCSRCGRATATTAGSTCRSRCSARRRRPRAPSACSTAACSRPATAPT